MKEMAEFEPGAALVFPDPRQEAAERAREFQARCPDERWQAIFDAMAFGLAVARQSPRRAEIERRWDEDEADFHRIQRELIARHAK